MYHECEYCGKQVHDYDRDGHRTTRVNMKFCRNDCRDKYWANVRKVERAYERAAKAISALRERESGQGVFLSDTLRQVVRDRLYKLNAQLNDTIPDETPQGYGVLSKSGLWECQSPECKQRRFTNPMGNPCNYCGKSNWLAI